MVTNWFVKHGTASSLAMVLLGREWLLSAWGRHHIDAKSFHNTLIPN